VVSGVWDRIASARYRGRVVRSVAATVATILFFGWLLIIASAIEVIQAVMVGHWVGFFRQLLAAILFGVIGVVLIARPLISAEALTVAMAVFFLIGACFSRSPRLRLHCLAGASRRPTGSSCSC
jgi:uncharacterized membrane protein HdeD (DUF308 family)